MLKSFFLQNDNQFKLPAESFLYFHQRLFDNVGFRSSERGQQQAGLLGP